MSAIKDILSTVTDIAKNKIARDNIRAELKDELKLNLDFLRDIKTGKTVSRERLADIVQNLEFIELDSFLKCSFPKILICSRSVTEKVIGTINAKRLLTPEGEPNISFEELCRRIRRMTRFIKKDAKAMKDPKRSLHYIKNYIRVALVLLR